MPPKQRITREMILEKSFAIFCQEGMEAVNARSVAKALCCSTQPIFSYFEGMDDLRSTIEQKARDTFAEAITSGTREGGLQGCCAAYIRLASEQPRLFARLMMNRDAAAGEPEADGVRAQLMEAVRAQYGMDDARAQALLRELWVYVHGLAALVAAGRLSADAQDLAGRIASVCDAIAARIRG